MMAIELGRGLKFEMTKFVVDQRALFLKSFTFGWELSKPKMYQLP